MVDMVSGVFNIKQLKIIPKANFSKSPGLLEIEKETLIIRKGPYLNRSTWDCTIIS